MDADTETGRDGLDGVRLLLVDDEPMIRHVFRRWLVAEGASVVAADSAAAAFDKLSDGERFDAIISDYRMPGLSGAELAAWTRQRWPDLPVLLFSCMPEIALAGDRVVEKPVRGSDLTAAVLELLRGRAVTVRSGTLPRP